MPVVRMRLHRTATGRPVTSWVYYTTSCNTQPSAPEDGQNNCSKHVELTGFINKPLLLNLGGCLYYLYVYQWCTVKQISDNEIYLLIKYIKTVLWRLAKCLSYIQDAQCLKVNLAFLYTSLVVDGGVGLWSIVCWVWEFESRWGLWLSSLTIYEYN